MFVVAGCGSEHGASPARGGSFAQADGTEVRVGDDGSVELLRDGRPLFATGGQPGGKWFHVWTGTEHAGGQVVEMAAPIGGPPVFSRGADRADLRAIQ
jgi:hypothetical protein